MFTKIRDISKKENNEICESVYANAPDFNVFAHFALYDDECTSFEFLSLKRKLEQ